MTLQEALIPTARIYQRGAMHAIFSALLISPAFASALGGILIYFALGVIVLGLAFWFLGRFWSKLATFVSQAVMVGVILFEVYIASLVQARAGWGWTVVFVLVLGGWLGVRWFLNETRAIEAKARSSMPTCPYCKSTRISIQANYDTATCLDCGHSLHIERR